MIGHASLQSPLVKRAEPVTAKREKGLAAWQRRLLEALVSVLAFAVWGMLAYSGGFRLLARAEGISLSSSWLIDVLSLIIGVSGSIAGVSALWAIGMRALGRTPGSLVGAPDDGPADTAYRSERHPDGRYRGEDSAPRR
jgi:hypothetical protein